VLRLVEALARDGIEAVATREPGGSPGAEELRRLFVGGAPGRWDALTEALLVTAARRDHLVRTVWPAIEAGKWVVSDRFADSTIAYQGGGGGLARADLDALYRLVAGDFLPDLTLILDLPVDVGLARAAARGGDDRFERKGRDFHERLRQGFLAVAAAEPQRCVVLDASRDADAVHDAIWKVVQDRLR
jgi:dTMP kinase